MCYIGVFKTEHYVAMGMMKAVALEQYKQGFISMGKMAELMAIRKPEAMKLLNDLHIDWLDYTEKEIDDQASIAHNS